MSLPMKDAENLVVKEERLLNMFGSSMAPEIDVFNKTTLITSFLRKESCGAFSGYVYEAVMNQGWKLSSQLTKDK